MVSCKIGLVGLPNVGKSTFFHFLTRKNILIANYPFATIEPNVGIMAIPDERLNNLGEYWKSQKITPSFLEWIDIAGLVKGASQGLGLGNQFLSHIREVDLVCHIIRCFTDPQIEHVEKKVDPIRDWEIIRSEMILSDLEQVSRKIEKVNSLLKKQTNQEELIKEYGFLSYLQQNLSQEIPINQLEIKTEMKKNLRSYNLLTAKPVIVIANYNYEKELTLLREYLKKQKVFCLDISIKMENDYSELSQEEKKEFAWQTFELGFLAEKIKEIVGLKNFFTAGQQETKSWLAKKEMNAKECAGLIHSDIEKGFIKGQVYNYQDWLTYQDEAQLKKLGKIRTESSHYIIQEGDIVNFLFSKNSS